MSTNKKKSRRVTAQVKKEIRYRFEIGEDLLSLANEYKLNYGTLRNCSSKEEWQKGIQSEIVYLEHAEENNDKIKEELGSILKNYRKLRAVYSNERVRDANNQTVRTLAEYQAIYLREKILALGYEMDSKLYNIRDEIEEKQYELLKLKIESAKLELSDIQHERYEKERTAKDSSPKKIVGRYVNKKVQAL